LSTSFDIVIAGAGIVGLAHALVAARRGLRVAVVERDHRCVGASVRNFGFVTVSGQRAGDTWRRARRSRDVWAEVAPEAGIAIEHRGLWLLARRPAARAVLEAFVATGMGAACTLHDPRETARRAPGLRCDRAVGAMYSPHELRVESRDAIPRLAAWLAGRHGVRFGEQVLEVRPPAVRTSLRTLQAERVVLCPGTELTGVAAAALVPHSLKLTRLQMLRVRPQPALRLPGAVMGDLSLVRYRGYADLPQALPLRDQLEAEQAACLRHGIHLIAVQSADGTLVVGDSHHDEASPLPFASDEVDRLILAQLADTLDVGRCEVLERWVGVYPTGHGEDCLVAAPDSATRVVVVTSGTGASTAFGMAEDVFAAW
jgi:D-hydroxyproline dehydrogenase subunit beta